MVSVSLFHVISQSVSKKAWSPYFTKEYDPLMAGSIDGTDTEPHDKAIARAMESHYEPPHGLKSKPDRTLFVSRFGPRISKDDLIEYGDVVSATVIYDVVTGASQCYGFVEMKYEDDAWKIARRMNDLTLMSHKLFVDFEVGRTMKGWKPRRLGGGFGGKKESGQLRFGGKERPFKKPYLLGVPDKYKKPFSSLKPKVE
ncbi:U11/U12 small nuclear ribonucleoprotein 35 kDa protein-like isoform X2 [Copidosoma floridanum]|uniref:U11/U12 small nuclear ribonucleoprotein 35 kDa protein-like isoform X2 n=1 Tax=Copidosoma floridanum TaxID=29053 RepID=UPI0006C9B53D|nr:U11/U12 small nuclear ribonucleoprotein 35 kDa protein-like isoform X2 [Copidosoma floridanum]